VIKKNSINRNKNLKYALSILIILPILLTTSCQTNSQKKDTKLYWFIPDGMRADTTIFNIYEWANEGKLPNIKRMMGQGSYGYVIPTFPTHTPTNFATLFTGAYPKTHGVADGPMHIEGRPLDKVAVGGFSSAAKKVDPIWVTLENSGKDVLLLSIPGSTPPELNKGITIRGRWGGWGANFHAINFESESDLTQRKNQGRGSRLFFFGPPLTKYINTKSVELKKPKSYSPVLKTEMESYGSKIFAYLYDSTNDDKKNYNRILFTIDGKSVVTVLKEGEWSKWIPTDLTWNGLNVASNVRIKVIKLDDDGFFRVRFFYNNLNEYNVDPREAASKIVSNVGPMMDFVDNFPPQLIYYEEDKITFLEEMNMTFDWHTKATDFLLKEYNPDVYISDIYSPNQMLTSRWWMGHIDPVSFRYNEISEEEREKLWNEVKDMYKRLDDIIGKMLDNADKNTFVVLTSDHGAIPLSKWVRLNNLFAKKGWLKFEINKETGEPIIDWKSSKVIYLKMAHIYINPDGLDGNYSRASGEEYEKLRNEVISALNELKDTETGFKPVTKIVKWENVTEVLDLPKDRVGDLVIANMAGYGWNEEMTQNLKIFDAPLKSGYKQAILDKKNEGMWAPFIVIGPDVKKNYKITKPMEMADVYPTLMTLMDKELPEFVEGNFLDEMIS